MNNGLIRFIDSHMQTIKIYLYICIYKAKSSDLMASISDYRITKGFVGKLKHIIKDPNEGIDYASALKYKQSSQIQRLEEEEKIRKLIKSCKEAGEKQDFFKEKKTSLKEANGKLIQRATLDGFCSSKLMENPLVDALVKNKHTKTANHRNHTAPDQPHTKQQIFSKTFHLSRSFKSQPKPTTKQQSYRVIIKDRKAQSSQKQFIKYPSSSLLHIDPNQYKQKLENANLVVVNLDQQESQGDPLRSKLYDEGRESFKSKKFLRVPVKSSMRQTSLPNDLGELSGMMDTAYCSTKTKYFMDKAFFNWKIAFLRKKGDNLKLKNLKINESV